MTIAACIRSELSVGFAKLLQQSVDWLTEFVEASLNYTTVYLPFRHHIRGRMHSLSYSNNM